jgi:hypothetical protein
MNKQELARIVDCIVGAAMLEISAIVSDAVKSEAA